MAEPSEPIAARFPHGKGLAVPKPSENRDWFAVDCFLQRRVLANLTRSIRSPKILSSRLRAAADRFAGPRRDGGVGNDHVRVPVDDLVNKCARAYRLS